MRRRAALAIAVLIASVPVAPSPATAAQAGVPDPVRALKRQLRNEHGVRISETNRYFFGEKSTVSGSGTRISGSLQLAPSGPVAADFTWWDLPRPRAEAGPAGKPDPRRVIRVGDDVYDDGDHYPGPVPDGKKWIRFPNKHRGRMGRDMARDASLQPIDVYDPSMLKGVLKRSTRKPVSGGFLYRGTMSYQELNKVSKDALINWTSGRPIGDKSKGKVSWQLSTDRDGLPKRLITTDTAGAGKDPLVKRSDTRYTDWGFQPVITAPPADEVIDEADLLEYIRTRNTPIPEDAGNT
ncbi:hypothetical protein FHS43_000087 [Streptosporangium becharense]|uniref:Uncharacterized protein n=1 Tax=Streptosporangium becharense TaxID=1816182 RepID=A0A7W9IGI9_9ACTN|nr:hypothetical protein [Streptosporangium becharense]MBB2908841.1 hypothetical protein [Streptosporangium becharense]MBB5820141.1 hypothetical protein [Streptosporangium becharense]